MTISDNNYNQLSFRLILTDSEYQQSICLFCVGFPLRLPPPLISLRGVFLVFFCAHMAKKFQLVSIGGQVKCHASADMGLSRNLYLNTAKRKMKVLRMAQLTIHILNKSIRANFLPEYNSYRFLKYYVILLVVE